MTAPHFDGLVRPVELGDRKPWSDLYRAYARFYQVPVTDEQLDTVWGWLHDPAHEVGGLVAVQTDGRVVGLAHHREFSRPLRATVGGFLDDLFVDPDVRGSGVADALLAELRLVASARGWSVVRWITGDDNYRARAKYDQCATRTTWVTYDMSPATGDVAPLG